MDPELSLIMCNMTHVKKGALAYDPFVGTGSILVAAASRGATTWGADIDIRSAPPLDEPNPVHGCCIAELG